MRHTPSQPRRVLAYCRVSSLEQGTHGTSLDAQREEICRYCAAHEYPEPLMFVDTESGSGEKSDARLEQRRLMREVAPGDLVVVSKQDRWSRDTLFFLASVDDLDRVGARFLSLAERFDSRTPEGRFAASIMASTAELERARIRDRTVGARQRLRGLGLWVEGQPPLGYRRDDATRKLVIDELGASAVRRIFALCLAGYSTRQIARRIREEFPSVRAIDQTIARRILHDRRYLGELCTRGARHNGQLPADAQWIRGTHDPIIDAATFQRAAEALVARKKNTRPLSVTARNRDFLLRGCAFCAHCGHKLTSRAPGPHCRILHLGYYVCRFPRAQCPGVLARQDDVDAQVEREVLARLEELRNLLATAPAAAPTVGPDFAGLRARLVKRQANLVEAIAEGTLSRELARDKLAQLDGELAELDRREAEQASQVLREDPAARRVRLREVTTLRAAWSGLDVAQRRQVLEQLSEQVTLGRRQGAAKYTRGVWVLTITWRVA